MLRRRVLAVLLAALLCSLLTNSSRAHADDTAGLDISSTSVFTVDTVGAAVRASVTITFVNSTVDTTVGNSVRRQYFTGYRFPVPVGSSGQRAVDIDGRSVPITSEPIPDDERFLLFSLSFPDPLFSGDRTTIEVTYDITGTPPRSSSPSRVNPAYAAFTAYGIGDAGQASIEVRIPSAFVIDTFGDDETLAVSIDGGTTRYTVDAIDDPGNFAFFVSARNDAALARTEFTGSGDAKFVIRSWPDDPVWQQFVTDQIDDGIPLLTELIEHPWPIDETVEIRQAVTPYLYGYAGWFSAANAELEIGEDLDAGTVLHELSHAWFNSTWFTERWASEGLAQVYSDSALALLGGSPEPVQPPAADDPSFIPLIDWGAPKLEQGADAVEAFGYSTSHWVMQRIIEDVGFSAMADVVDDIEEGALPYSGDDTTPASAGLMSGAADWRRLLDLFEEVAGSDQAIELIGTHVVRPEDLPILSERGEARVAYADLTTAGGNWAPPLAVRRSMSNWEFATARKQISVATDALRLRDELQRVGDTLGIDITSDLEVGYEAADNLEDVAATLRLRSAAAANVTAAVVAVNSNPGLIEQVGLLGSDPNEFAEQARLALAVGDTEAASTAALRALELIDGAADAGTRRTAIGVSTTLILTALIMFVIRWRRSRTPPRPPQAAET